MPYRWEGPVDDRPVRDLIAACLAGDVDALAVMSSSQIHNLFAIAEEHDQATALQRALNDPRVLVAAVGPVTRDAIEAHGVHVDLEPEHPKMGHLITAIAARLGSRD
jgi:uroporphyrinogen-III synthase